MHWATVAIKKGNVWGMRAGLVLTFLMGLAFLISQIYEYLRAGFNTSDGAFPTIFFCLTGLHGCHVFVGLSILVVHDDPRLPRALLRRAPSRRRDRRDLLALRRRDVDRRFRDGLPSLTSG